MEDLYKVIRQAHEIADAINKQHDQLNAVMCPILKGVAELSAAELDTLIAELPPGYYRTEFQVVRMSRKRQ